MIENIPEILQFFVPGFLFLSIYSFIRAMKIQECHLTLYSVVISYIIVVMIHLIFRSIIGWEFLLVSILIGILFGTIFAKLLDLPCFAKVMRHLGRTANTNIWKDVIDFDLGTTVAITMKESKMQIFGTIDMIDETDGDPWVILRDYQQGDVPSTNEPYLTRLALNLRDVERIELYYQKETKRFSQ